MTISVYSYTSDRNLRVTEGLRELPELDDIELLWIDIETDEIEELQEVAARFNLHELTVEDCLTPSHFPKLDDYGTYIFMIFRGLRQLSVIEELRDARHEKKDNTPDPNEEEDLYTHKIAIYLSKKFIITFRRTEVGWLDAVARQVTSQPNETLGMGTDVLAHRIIDVLVDRFMRGIGFFDVWVDKLEDQLLENPDNFDIAKTLDLKRDLGSIRQIMRDQRAIIGRLVQDAGMIRGRDYRRYFKDVEDHALSIVITLDKQIESVLGIRDSYFALSNVRLGDTMRVLTVITTVVAPLNVVVGLYGMNFQVIPLLHNPYGFWIVMFGLFFLTGLMLLFFRRKKWL